MSVFGKDADGLFNQDSNNRTDGGMSMDEIDRLLDQDELDRLLNDDDVATFIDSENFKELLDAEDLDDILNVYRKSEPAQTASEVHEVSVPERKTEELPQEPKAEPASFAPKKEPDIQAASPAQAEPAKPVGKKSDLSFTAEFPAQSRPKAEPPKYQERFQSFTVELNRSEVEELAKKQAQQQAAVKAKAEAERAEKEEPAAVQPEASAEAGHREQEAPQPKPEQPAPEKTAEEKKPLFDDVFGIPIPQEKHQEVQKPVEESRKEPAQPQEEPKRDWNLNDELDIDALIREIEEESKAYGFGSILSQPEKKQETESPAAPDEKIQPEPTISQPAVETPADDTGLKASAPEEPRKPEPVPVKEAEKAGEPVVAEPEARKKVTVQDTTFEIDIPKEEIKENAPAGTFEISIPKEAMELKPAAEPKKETEKAEISDIPERQMPEVKEPTATLKIDPAEFPSQNPAGKKHRYAFLGIIMTILALVGIGAVAYFGFGFAKDFFSQKEVKSEFNHRVYPLVVVDVPAFESVDKLDSKVVIQAGIWNFLLNEENTDKYEQDDFGTMTVPALDIEVYIRQIFGSNVEIVHQQLSDADFTVIYDEEKQLYYIPTIPQSLPYAPSVQSVTHTGSDYTVTVGYVLPGPFWNIEQNMDDEEINKTMIYHYTKTKDGDYWIQSVENGDLSLNGASYPADAGESEAEGTTSDSLSSETEEDTASTDSATTESSSEAA